MKETNQSFKFNFEDIRKKLAQNRPLILVLITIAILTATIFRQTLANVIKLAGENGQKEKELKELTAKVDYLQNLDKNQIEAKVKEVEQVFPSRKPALQLLVMLKSLAVENRLSMGSLTLTPGKLESDKEKKAERDTGASQGEIPEEFLVNFSITGTSNNISDFIQLLEKTAPLTQIETVGVSIADKVENDYLLEVSLAVRVYYQSLPEKIPGINEPLAQLTVHEEEALDSLADFKYYPPVEAPGGSGGKENLFKKSL